MGAVQLEQSEAGGVRAPGGRARTLDDVADLGGAELARHVQPSSKGSALGATGCQPPSSGASGLPLPGRGVRPLRPACASWMPGTAPCARGSERCAAGLDVRVLQMPESSGLMRPSRHDRARLDDHQRRAAGRPRAEVHEMPVVGEPVL